MTLSQIRNFLFAGHATFTLVSKKTNTRKTFRVELAPKKEGTPQTWFVKLLTGPDNTAHYTYIGFLRNQGPTAFIPKFQNESTAAFGWLVTQINGSIFQPNHSGQFEKSFAEQAEFYHSGRCGRCGRTLTTPESIESGIGPVCEGRVS